LITRKGEKEWVFPQKVNTEPITLQTAIGHLPSLESGQTSDIKHHNSKKHNENHILWMKHTPSGKTAMNNEIYYPNVDGRKIKGFSTTYKRMEWDKPAPTVTMMNGSILSQNNVHPGREYLQDVVTLYSDARVLTIHELLIVTGLPIDWDIPEWASDTLIRHLLGECVLPKVVYHLVKNLYL